MSIGDTIHISGVDMVHGTPVLDIKPYLPMYDSPEAKHCINIDQSDTNSNESLVNDSDSALKQSDQKPIVKVPQWIDNPEDNLQVIFSSRAKAQILSLDVSRLQWLKSHSELKSAISDVLSTDPR